MSAQATPRPWEADGRDVCSIEWGGIATVHLPASMDGRDVAEANARLIVAAVNEREGLLEALRGLVSVFVELPAARNYQEQTQAARKAIAEAEAERV